MQREPIFNVPASVILLLIAFLIVYLVRAFVLTDDQDIEFLLRFAFIPARYENTMVLGGPLPGGFGAEIWTFVSYAFIHADIMHLGINALWFLPFGTAVARRLGGARFFLFFAVTAAAGAALHLATHVGAMAPVIGASAAVSGTMAGAMRFAFQRGGPLGMWRTADEESYRVPALPLSGMLREPRVVIFLVIWFGLNLLFGLGNIPVAGQDQEVAWQAHVGGFLAGLLLFALFDPVRRSLPAERLPPPTPH